MEESSYYCDGCGKHRCVCIEYPSFDCRDDRKNILEVSGKTRNLMFEFLRDCKWKELDDLIQSVRNVRIEARK